MMDAQKLPRTVTVVTAGDIFGGAERQILNLLGFLLERGQACALIVFHDRDLARRARELGVPTSVVGEGGRFELRAVRELVIKLRETSTDVVHIHGYKAAVHVAAARLFVPFRAVKTEHGSLELRGGSMRALLKVRAYRTVENLCVRLLGARIVYVTRDLAAACAREHASQRTCVIYNGLDPRQVRDLPRPAELDPAAFNIVIAGRLEPVKGIDLALQALRSERLPPTATLVIIGDGPLRESLQRQAREWGVAQRSRFLGFRTDAAAFIRHADVVMMPSLHEGLPYTLLEAAAAGTPVAVSRVGGLAEVLVDGQTALLFPAGSVPDIIECLVRLYSDPPLRQRIGAAASETVATRFSSQAMGEAYLRLFSEVASGH
jgi:glycosyltransferase involved in cell wall biosynthesis